MKMILLLSAAYSNGNSYVDAGAQVEVGEQKHQITEERAEDLVVSGRAEEVEVEVDDSAESDADDLDKLKVADLKALADEEGVDLGSATTKPAIIAAIREHRAG